MSARNTRTVMIRVWSLVLSLRLLVLVIRVEVLGGNKSRNTKWVSYQRTYIQVGSYNTRQVQTHPYHNQNPQSANSPLPPLPLSLFRLYSSSSASLSSLISLSTSSLTAPKSGGITCICTLGLPSTYRSCSLMPTTTLSKYCLLFRLLYLPLSSGNSVGGAPAFLSSLSRKCSRKGVCAGRVGCTSAPMQMLVS